MPYKEKEIERRYWTIGLLADELCVETSALRYWELEGLFPRASKNRRGFRVYNARQRALVKKAVYLLHSVGMTVKGLKLAQARGLEDDIVSLYCPI